MSRADAAPLPSTTSVLIIGGGLVGLSLAVLLAALDVDTVLVERHASTSAHPRARGVNVRSMEVMRSVGLEELIRSTPSARALAGNHGIVAAESLTGRWFGQLEGATHRADPRAAAWTEQSPTSWAMCDQDELEPLLAERACELGAVLAFGHEVVDCGSLADETADGPDEVTVVERSSGRRCRVRAGYVVAADGSASPTRKALGIPTDGPGTLGHFANIHFHADLASAVPAEPFVLCYVRRPELSAALLPIDNARRWLLHVPLEHSWEDERHRFADDAAVELVRLATGVPDLAVDIRGVLPWESAGRVARLWRSGRTLLAGDAVHVMPPTGAFGSNTGIGDAHNLAWKLAAVLNGDADPPLLDTYESERRPVAGATMEQAVLRSVHRRPSGSAPAGLIDDDRVILGFRYVDGALCSEPDSGRAPFGPVGTGEPGTRAPHLPRADGTSVLDVFGPRFVLLTADPAWRSDLTGRHRTVVLTDPAERSAFRSAYGVGERGAALVRPDGVVGWRTTGPAPQDPHATVSAALASILRSAP